MIGIDEDPTGLWLFLALLAAAFAYIEATRKPDAKKDDVATKGG